MSYLVLVVHRETKGDLTMNYTTLSKKCLYEIMSQKKDTRKTTYSGFKWAARWRIITSPLNMVHPWLNKQIKKCQIQFKNQASISTLRETKPANHQVQHLHVRPIKKNQIYYSTAVDEIQPTKNMKKTKNDHSSFKH